MLTDEKQPANGTPADAELEAAAKEAVQVLSEPAAPAAQTNAPPPKQSTPYHSQEELEAHDRHILEALDAMLERRTVPPPPKRPHATQQEESAVEKFVLGMVRKGAGIISLSLVLILMGIVVLYCFFTKTADMLLPLKLSPIAAILLGLELLVYHLASNRKFRIHIPAIIITAMLVAACCILAVTLNKTYTKTKEEYTSRSIAAEIYESGYHELRHAAEIENIDVFVDLNPNGKARENGIKSLGADDTVELTVTFSGAYESAKEFAGECKTVIDAYKFLDIPVTTFHFISDNKFTCCRLIVKGKFMQDLTEAELTSATSCVFVDDYGYVSDLDDLVEEETAETSETTERV